MSDARTSPAPQARHAAPAVLELRGVSKVYGERRDRGARPAPGRPFGRSRLADSALDAWATMVDEPEPVTHTVQEITGAPACTFRQWATDHVGDFR
jgi:hypothetical protein